MEINMSQRGRGRREVNTADMPVGQMPPVDLDSDLSVVRNEEILAVDTPMMTEQMAALAFNEQPVTIRIERSSEKNAPMHIPVSVNGRGAEVLHDGKWIEVRYLETGRILTVKRKYVEVLARSKPMDIQTVHEDTNVERPRNEVIRTTRAAHPITIVRDDDPRGHEWLTRIMAEG